MTYAIYLRKSRKDDEVISGDTLSRHEKMLMDLADRMGIVIHEHDISREYQVRASKPDRRCNDYLKPWKCEHTPQYCA